jgi:DNA-directed RNA polymerase specialized sigma24 family protein
MATEDSLHKLRADGDPVAREFLDEALKKSGRFPAEVLAGLREPAADSPQWLHSLLDEWVRQGPALPPWANQEQIAAGDRDAQMRAAVRRLPVRDRQLLTLLMASPRPSYRTVSAELRIPAGSIGPTRARCLRRLRHELEDVGIDGSC